MIIIRNLLTCRAAFMALCALFLIEPNQVFAQDTLPWLQNGRQPTDQYEQVPQDIRPYSQENPRPQEQYPERYEAPQQYNDYNDRRAQPQYGDPYSDEVRRRDYATPYPPGRDQPDYLPPPRQDPNQTYSQNEIIDAGHRFFGSVSGGLAKVVAYAFRRSGRPNGYILGEGAGGAFFAGLRYGEGTLVTKHLGNHKVYWQGPSLGYDFGAEGSKSMVLVYNLRHPEQLFHRFGGVDGSAYLVGGVGITFQKYGDVILAPIRSGVGVRLGANIGYLKYSRRPTWNPF